MAKDSFFIGGKLKKANQKKRKLAATQQESDSENEKIIDVDSMNLEHEKIESESEDEIQESAAQKRLRLAKSYLAKVEGDVDDGISSQP